MRYRGGGVVMGASLSALVLVASGCTGAEEAEPTPSFASPTADADPSPELTEPPYETELNLTPDEKKAADEAYDVLVNYIKANNEVMADSGGEPDRALQFVSGELREEHVESFGSMADAGEVAVGGVSHRYHHLDELEKSSGADGEAVFESCLDFSNFDLLDEDGESLSGGDTEPSIVRYSLDGSSSGWSLTDIEFTEYSCD